MSGPLAPDMREETQRARRGFIFHTLATVEVKKLQVLARLESRLHVGHYSRDETSHSILQTFASGCGMQK